MAEKAIPRWATRLGWVLVGTLLGLIGVRLDRDLEPTYTLTQDADFSSPGFGGKPEEMRGVLKRGTRFRYNWRKGSYDSIRVYMIVPTGSLQSERVRE